MSIFKPVSSFNAMLFACLGCLIFVGFSESWLVAMRYAIYIACIASNGFFLVAVGSKLPKRKKLYLLLAVVVTNLLAVYFIFPKVVLVIGFWVPGIVGYLVGRSYAR